MFLQIIIQQHRFLSAGLIQHDIVILHERTALEHRTFLLDHHLCRHTDCRLVRKSSVILSIYINTPFVACLFKILGKPCLMPTDRIQIPGNHRHVVPVIMEHIGVTKRFPHCNKMRLDMIRNIPIRHRAKRIIIRLKKLCNSPEIHIFLIHLGKHICKWIHRSHHRIIHQHDLIIGIQLLPADLFHRFFIRPDIKSNVIAHKDLICKSLELFLSLV